MKKLLREIVRTWKRSCSPVFWHSLSSSLNSLVAIFPARYRGFNWCDNIGSSHMGDPKPGLGWNDFWVLAGWSSRCFHVDNFYLGHDSHACGGSDWKNFEPEEVDGKLMAIVGLFGFAFNVSRGIVLGHSHNHHGDECCDGDELVHVLVHEDEHGHRENSGFITWIIAHVTGADIENPAVRAAFLCVVSDSLQNIGVNIALLVIYRNESWTLVDPCVTILFSIVGILATKDLARQKFGILMGTPRGVSVDEIQELLSINSVIPVNELRASSITMKRTVLTANICKDNSASDEEVLKQAEHILKNKFNIAFTTVQI